MPIKVEVKKGSSPTETLPPKIQVWRTLPRLRRRYVHTWPGRELGRYQTKPWVMEVFSAGPEFIQTFFIDLCTAGIPCVYSTTVRRMGGKDGN
jgi:hypothetical protein